MSAQESFPWTQGTSHDGKDIVFIYGGQEERGQSYGHPARWIDCNDADIARLVAAAPCLLDALDTLLNRIELEGGDMLDCPAYKAGRAIVAKATGAA